MRFSLLIATIGFTAVLCLKLIAKPVESFDNWLNGPWQTMSVSIGIDDGCCGMHLYDGFTVTRKGATMRLSRTGKAYGGKPLPNGSRPLDSHELVEIKRDLQFHLLVAMMEYDPKQTIQRAGGEYIHVKFGEGKSSYAFYKDFKKSESWAAYSNWVTTLTDLSKYAKTYTPRTWTPAEWKGVTDSVREEHPDAELIFERFHPDRDIATQVFLDRRSERVLVISWSKDTQAIFKRNGETDSAQSSKITSLEKGEWIQRPTDGSVSLTLISILSEIRITWDASETKPATAIVQAKK